MKPIFPQGSIDIMERTTYIIDYMASSIASKEANALIEQAGAFYILTDASDQIKKAMDEVIAFANAVNKSINEASSMQIIDERFSEILERNITPFKGCSA